MKLGGLAEHFQPGLEMNLPLGDPALNPNVEWRPFRVPLASAELGAWCHLASQAGAAIHGLSESSTDDEIRAAMERIEKIPTSDTEVPLPQKVLREAYTEMATAGVPDPYITHAGMTAFVWILAGEERAEEYWKSGRSLGKAGNREERRAQARAATRSTRTAAADRTPSPDSTNGTNDPLKSKRRKKGRGSAGRSS